MLINEEWHFLVSEKLWGSGFINTYPEVLILAWTLIGFYGEIGAMLPDAGPAIVLALMMALGIAGGGGFNQHPSPWEAVSSAESRNTSATMGFDFRAFLICCFHGLVSGLDEMASRFDFSRLNRSVRYHLRRCSSDLQMVFSVCGWLYSA
jgi:hypothetical protein